MNNFNNSRIFLLIKKFNKLNKKNKFNKIIWIGPSYKPNSFSLVNSPFLKFANFLKKQKKNLIAYDSFFDLAKENVKPNMKQIKTSLTKSLLILN